MKKAILLSGILVSIFFMMNACEKDQVPAPPPPTPCDSISVSFNNQIQPMIINNCAEPNGAQNVCHSSGNASGGYVLETHTQISGSAEISLSAMKHEIGFEPMPYFQPKLNDTLIQQMQCWIEQGKLNN